MFRFIVTNCPSQVQSLSDLSLSLSPPRRVGHVSNAMLPFVPKSSHFHLNSLLKGLRVQNWGVYVISMKLGAIKDERCAFEARSRRWASSQRGSTVGSVRFMINPFSCIGGAGGQKRDGGRDLGRMRHVPPTLSAPSTTVCRNLRQNAHISSEINGIRSNIL